MIVGTFIAAGLIGWSSWRTHGKPVEHLTVVNVQRQLAADCNRFRHVQLHHWVVTWRSTDPPTGRPAEFTSIECRSWDPGETVRLVRTSGGTRTDVVPPEEGPFSSHAQAWATTVAVLVPILFLGRWGWVLLAERYGRTWSIRRRFRRVRGRA